MASYTHRFVVNAPLHAVAAYHSDAQALKRLTPFPIIVQLHEIQPLAENSRVDFTMWFGPVPVRWLAVHHDVDPERGFIDVQDRGPFSSWIHRHTFNPIDAQTSEVIDQIDATTSRHILWGPLSYFMWLTLPFLFFHRQRITRRILEQE